VALAMDCCAVNDKQILNTGATNGIGLAAAEALAARGANLAIVGRSKTRTRIAPARIWAAAGRRATVATFIADLSCAGPLSKARCARQQRRCDVGNTAADEGRHRTNLGGQPPGAVSAQQAPPPAPEGESAPARIITTVSQAHQGAHPVMRREAEPAAAL
jgi:hypothetical protein